MTSHHVTCHVTCDVMYLFIVTKKKEKEIQKKRNIKSRKMLVSKVFHNIVTRKRVSSELQSTTKLLKIKFNWNETYNSLNTREERSTECI